MNNYYEDSKNLRKFLYYIMIKLFAVIDNYLRKAFYYARFCAE